MAIVTVHNKEKKLLKKIEDGTPISSDEAERLLEFAGFQFERQKGSHRTFRHQKTGEIHVIMKSKKLHKYLVNEIFKNYWKHKDLE